MISEFKITTTELQTIAVSIKSRYDQDPEDHVDYSKTICNRVKHEIESNGYETHAPQKAPIKSEVTMYDDDQEHYVILLPMEEIGDIEGFAGYCIFDPTIGNINPDLPDLSIILPGEHKWYSFVTYPDKA